MSLRNRNEHNLEIVRCYDYDAFSLNFQLKFDKVFFCERWWFDCYGNYYPQFYKLNKLIAFLFKVPLVYKVKGKLHFPKEIPSKRKLRDVPVKIFATTIFSACKEKIFIYQNNSLILILQVVVIFQITTSSSIFVRRSK